MTTSASRYPHAPIVEVVCGVQFGPLRWRSIDFGRLADTPAFAARFREYQDRAPMPPETAGIVLQLGEPVPDHRRVMYIEPGANRLVQVQPDRFLANWRRVQPADKCPSFGPTFQFFKDALAAFSEYAATAGRGAVTPTGYELTYINHVPLDGDPMAPFELRLAGAESRVSGGALMLDVPFPQDAGVLHLNIQSPVQRLPDMAKLAFFELTSKTSARGADMDAWFNQAHAMANQVFDEVTTEDYKRKWREAWPR
ncbi:MAG: TIGR04255 family protein [Deltaproteobacteria bacterium]|nr:TIGR04255 family protein [Deltaproteobacteria bacterium]